jgi:hypothetical protein
MPDDRSYTDPLEAPSPQVTRPHPALPDWLARRLLRAGEEITWVRGPRRNPWWEQFATHPALFLVALALGAAGCLAGRLAAGSWADVMPVAFLVAFVLVLASILVLGISAAYFTRLVVTNHRVVILQGYELCRGWNVEDLPPSLIRYGRGGERESRAVDLEGLQAMLGGSSSQFAEAKSILAFGKQLDRIKACENGRPWPGPDSAG